MPPPFAILPTHKRCHKAGRGLDTPPGSPGFGFGLNEAAAAAEVATAGDVLILDPRNPSTLAAEGVAAAAAAAVDIEKQAPRWPEEERNRNNDNGDGGDGDVLDLRPDQAAVRRRTPGAPAFEKQVGWRERQAAEALEEGERVRARREAWGWGAAGEGRAGGDGKGGDDPVERADRGTR